MELAAREVAFETGSGGVGMSARRFFEMPDPEGRLGKLAAFDRDAGRSAERRTAGAVPDGR